jgi:prevent-host-death family protein
MTQTTVGIRDLKARSGGYLRQVKDGATMVITERGKPIGRIVPVSRSVETHLRELVQAGLVAWSGRKLMSIDPVPRTQGRRTVAELLLEDRVCPV